MSVNWSPLVQIMACCLFDTRPLTSTNADSLPIGSWGQTSMKFETKYKYFNKKNAFENVINLVAVSICKPFKCHPCMWDLNSVSIVPADAAAPYGAGASADTVLMIGTHFFQVSLSFKDFLYHHCRPEDVIQTGRQGLAKSRDLAKSRHFRVLNITQTCHYHNSQTYWSNGQGTRKYHTRSGLVPMLETNTS